MENHGTCRHRPHVTCRDFGSYWAPHEKKGIYERGVAPRPWHRLMTHREWHKIRAENTVELWVTTKLRFTRLPHYAIWLARTFKHPKEVALLESTSAVEMLFSARGTKSKDEGAGENSRCLKNSGKPLRRFGYVLMVI